MKLEDLNVGDILIPNGTFRGAVTKAVHENNIALVVTRIDAPHHFFVAIAVASSDKARVGEKMALHENDLACFNVHYSYIEYHMRKENKALYLKWSGDESFLGRIGEESPFTDDSGNELYVGDTVTITYGYHSWNNCVVVHNDTFGYFVMGIRSFCHNDCGVISKYAVQKDSSWTDRVVGERISQVGMRHTVEVTDENPFINHKPSKPKKDLYLRWRYGKKTSLGRIGDKTPYKLENGRNLFVGDVVSIKNDNMEEKGRLVVHDEDDGYYIMGISSACNSKTGEIKYFTVSLENSFSGIKNCGTFATTLHRNGIEVVDFNPEE